MAFCSGLGLQVYKATL